jgi:hypothetical protein
VNAPDTADVLAGLHATAAADDADRLAKQIKAAKDVAAWVVFLTAALSPFALIVAVAIGGRSA